MANGDAASAEDAAQTQSETAAGRDLSLFYAMDGPAGEYPHGVGADEAINIIEEGDQVSNDDFGLSSTEISMNPMHSTINSMDMNMELNALQIHAFLVRNESSLAEATANASSLVPHQEQAQSEQQQQPLQQPPATELADSSSHSEAKAPLIEPSFASGSSNVYDASRDVVYYSRREDKIKQIRSHPIVAAISLDGRMITCKCGRNVRLNPPWYILKFEQHVVSRNCTFLRTPKPTAANKSSQPSPKQLPPSSSAIPASSSVGSTRGPLDKDQSQQQGTGENDLSCLEILDQDVASNGDQERAAAKAKGNSIKSARAEQMEEVSTEDDDPTSYRLRSLAEVLAADFETTVELAFEPPPDIDSKELLQEYEAAVALKSHPHFSRITPDGRFIECKCSRLVILTQAWEISKFLEHVASKQKLAKRRKVTAVLKPPKKKPAAVVAKVSAPEPRHVTDTNTFRAKKKSFPREIHWDAVHVHGLIPCPGLRDEKMSAFVAAAVQLTGGSRPRHKIAQEMFPQLFTTGEPTKITAKLSPEERIALHDAVESEALWFIDKDGNSIRSLHCSGMVDARKGETVCVSCTSLRSNASLRTAASTTLKKAKTPRNPLNRKFGSTRAFSMLESEFNMDEEHARTLRDLSLADIADDSVLNMWFDMGEMGIEGAFDSHPALIGLIESMVTLKDKERRGVGMQNMNYSDHLDNFMRSISDLSMEACEFFQHHLCGRKQKMLLTRKRKLPTPSNALISQSLRKPFATEAQQHELLYDAAALSQTETFDNLLDGSGGGMMPTLSITDMHDVDLSSFSTSTAMATGSDVDQSMSGAEDTLQTRVSVTDDGNVTEYQTTTDDANDNEVENDAESSSLSTVEAPLTVAAPAPKLLDHVPCCGLRDDKVQLYVTQAVQIIGGSRPKYVIAKELFPQVFTDEKKVKIVEKLNDDQKHILQDAVFSECLWRVDKLGKCVRSLRCHRTVDSLAKAGACRACQDLKSVANFRSVLSRAKAPKNLENVKFVPSVYTESDPFLRKLSKNSSFRALYQVVKEQATADEKKKAAFWLKCARMGLFGHFRTHPVFEGLIESMVEIKDKERRGVGKQNMQYSRPLDDFMNAFSAISMEAFEIFASQFCGRTIRSQKVKKRKVHSIYDPNMAGMEVVPQDERADDLNSSSLDPGHDHHQLMVAPEDLLVGRTMSTSEMEENQRFMDRMLDEVRLSGGHERDSTDNSQLDPQTYLDAAGVLI